MAPHAAAAQMSALDEREVRLLAALAAGTELTTAARRLGVSARTARRTARSLEGKLGATTLLQAVYLAAKRGDI